MEGPERGSLSVLAGYRSKAKETGAFACQDSTEARFDSTHNNQFLIRASAIVGIRNEHAALEPGPPFVEVGRVTSWCRTRFQPNLNRIA